MAFAQKLAPDLVHPVDLIILIEHAFDLLHEPGVTTHTQRCRFGVFPAAGTFMVGGWGDLQHTADLLDPVIIPVRIDKAGGSSLSTVGASGKPGAVH